MYVKFKGNKLRLARLAILASVAELEDVPLDEIYNPSYIPTWIFEGKSYVVNFFCPSDVLIHPIEGILPRPWSMVYATAEDIVLAAGLEIVEKMTSKERLGIFYKKGCCYD